MKPLISTTAPATEPQLICRGSIALADGTPTEIMFMPAGLQTITPSQNGKPVTVSVMVDEAGALALERQRALMAAAGNRPYFDLGHSNGEASFWPEKFFWKSGPNAGIYARGEWTAAGRGAVEGKTYRQFSPVFHVDDVNAKPARIVCQTSAGPNMGGLVNDPAFKTILPLWARDAADAAAAGAHPSNQQTNTENAMLTREELAALQARNVELQNEVNALKAKDQTDAVVAAELRAKEAEIKANAATLDNEALKARAEKLEADAKTRAEADADSAIAAAVARGALPAKDTALQARWKQLIVADPSNAALLASQAGHPALGSMRTGTHVQVGNTGVLDNVRAFNALMARQADATSMEAKSLIAREAGAIYAMELRNRVEDLPLVCDNSLGTAAGTLVTMRTLELLKFTFPVLSAITTDFSAENANYGQVITTRTTAVPTVGTYNTSTGYAQTDQNATDVPVTLNRHKFVQSQFNANILGGTMRNLFAEFAPSSAYALAKDLVDALYALFTSTNFTATPVTKALADWGRDALIDVATTLDLAGVPQGSMNRTALLYSTYFRKLEKDGGSVLNAVTALAAFQKPEIITEGVLPSLDGFKVINAPNLPDLSENLVGFAFSKSAAVIASRVPNDYSTVLPGAAFGNIQVVTNPDTGLSCLQTQYVDHTLGAAIQRIAMMNGVAKGQVTAAVRITSA